MKPFLNSYLKYFPKTHHNHIRSLQKHPALIIHHPILASSKNKYNDISIIAEKNIPVHNTIFQISGGQSFNNRQFLGARQNEILGIQQNFKKAIKKFQIIQGEEIKGILKIMIQIYANQVELIDGNMPLNSFAYVLDEGNQKVAADFDKYEQLINSPHLYNILQSHKHFTKKFHKIMQQELIKWDPEEKDFIRLFNTIRKLSRRLSTPSISGRIQQNVDYIAPVIPSIKQSFSPNCKIVGKYFTHLKSSFYCIESLRQIQQNQQLSIGYRQGFNSYDLLLRYGVLPQQALFPSSLDDQKPWSQYLLLVNLMEDAENILTGDIDFKKQLLIQNKMKMKNSIKIKRKGVIKDQDMKMLRILLTGKDSGPQSESKDKHIYKFLTKPVKQNLQMLKKRISTNKNKQNSNQIDEETDLTLKSIRTIEKQEIQILQQFLSSKQHQ